MSNGKLNSKAERRAEQNRIRRERKEEEALRLSGHTALKVVEIAKAPAQMPASAPITTPVATAPATIPAATTSPATTATAPANQFPRGERKPGDTVAGQTKYDRYFGLFARVVREGKISGFRPLGFIPGPAVVLEFEGDDNVRIVAGTPEEVQRLGNVPTNWTTPAALPAEIQKPLEAYETAVGALDFNPSPYHQGFAKKLLGGKLPPAYLCILMSNFRYRAGDPERPFGIVLLPEVNGMRVGKVYNPAGIPEAPPEGTILSLDTLKSGFGPVQKLLRTWALMEDNYSMRFDESGNRLANGGYRPPPQRQPAQV